jgi:long-chain acyl-CoA synthetase
MAGTTVSYARSVQQLGEDLRTIRPTVLMSVPRIFQTVYSAIRAKLDAGPTFRKWLFEQAVEVGYARFEYQQRRTGWRLAFLLWPLLDALVARTVMERLGGNLRLAVSGGAALPPDLSRIFIGLGLPVIQGYGLTETSPISNANRIDNNLPASIGPTVPGVEVKLNEQGVLLIRGPNIMLGYWKNPQATAAAIDAEGWFNSGDIARIDLEGRVYITGRQKEIIVMSNGEKVPPADIEAAILRDPLFTQVMLVGEGKPYLSLLAVLNPEQWEKFALAQGFSAAPDELQTKPVQTALLARVAAQTRGEFPGYAQVRRITASFEPWTIDNGLMTPTLKLCRGRVAERVCAEIEAMYAGFSL